MDSNVPTISHNPLKHQRTINDARVSPVRSNNSEPVNEQNSYRKTRLQNQPGIRVTLQSQEQQPQLDEYLQLRSDGRRKDTSNTKVVDPEATHRVIEGENAENKNTQSERSVNPRSKIILDSFIQQMGGTEKSLSSGSYFNISV